MFCPMRSIRQNEKEMKRKVQRFDVGLYKTMESEQSERLFVVSDGTSRQGKRISCWGWVGHTHLVQG